ncbi:MAG: FtsX-like permease family protein [Acidobacteria bacterium]|nr:FtsX-like permease family protein [Acidobacteriota bacterium]
MPLDDALVAPVRTTLLLLFGAVALVFVIAIANVANLLLIRSMERTSEFAMRMALGSGARRLWRQIITESALLGVAGAALGLWLAYAGVAVLHQLNPTGVPRLQDVAVDRVTLVLAAATTVLSVLFLSWVAARHALSGTPLLQQSARGSSQRSRPAQQLLLVAQVSLSVMLLCGAGLLARSVLLLNRVDLGFDPTNVVSARLSLPDARYPYRTAGPAIGEFYRRLDERLAAVGATLGPTLSDLPVRPKPYAYRVRGGEVEWGSLAADYRTVTPGWFTAVGARLVAGRVFDDRDRWDRPIAVVVDTALAEKAWPGQDAIRRHRPDTPQQPRRRRPRAGVRRAPPVAPAHDVPRRPGRRRPACAGRLGPGRRPQPRAGSADLRGAARRRLRRDGDGPHASGHDRAGRARWPACCSA